MALEFQKLTEKIKESTRIALELKRIREKDPQREISDILREIRKTDSASEEITEEI